MKLLYFAQTRRAAGVSEENISFASPLDETSLWQCLVELHPSLHSHRANTRLARNGAFTSHGELFYDGDEVALIPPVSGG